MRGHLETFQLLPNRRRSATMQPRYMEVGVSRAQGQVQQSTIRSFRMPGRLGGILALFMAVALVACIASSAALAFTPKGGETVPSGTVVEGKCKSGAGQDFVGEQWTVNTDDPQRTYAPGKTLAPMEIAPSLVPYGDFGLGREGIGAHSHIFPDFEYEEPGHVFDPRFSGKWDWFYTDQWAVNFQGGSEGYFYLHNHESSCEKQVAEDTSADTPGGDHEHPAFGSYAGAFTGESVSQGHGLELQRPGPYALDQWKLKVHYKQVSPAEFKAHPFLARALGETEGCANGTRIFNENAVKEAEEKGESVESERVKAAFIYEEGMEDDYRVAGPAPLTEWKAETYCLEGTATQFVVTGAHGGAASAATCRSGRRRRTSTSTPSARSWACRVMVRRTRSPAPRPRGRRPC